MQRKAWVKLVIVLVAGVFGPAAEVAAAAGPDAAVEDGPLLDPLEDDAFPDPDCPDCPGMSPEN
jgi:hypothetical protein